MRVSLLHLNSHLDMTIERYLQPPVPISQQDQTEWGISNPSVRNPFTPLVSKWEPPSYIRKIEDGVFCFTDSVICYQRGYCPIDIRNQYVNLAASCFHRTREEVEDGINLLAYDFLITIQDALHNVKAACMVEFRCSSDKNKTPYLYICTLCTDTQHRKRGFASQMVHAVHMLGIILIEQNETAGGNWRNSIPGQNLFLGLTVRKKNVDSKVVQSLVRMYTRCGFTRRTENTPQFDYKSFTPYSNVEWRIDRQEQNIAMWKHISPDTFYEDENIAILNPSKTAAGVLMYHKFDPLFTNSVQKHGLVHTKHSYLYQREESVYTVDNLIFSSLKPIDDSKNHFRILTRHKGEVKALYEFYISLMPFFEFT